jgi:hypothetical protein
MKKKTLRYTCLYLTHRQVNELKKEAEEKFITFAEVVRRALDKYIDDKKL